MALSHRIISDVFRDLYRGMNSFNQPTFYHPTSLFQGHLFGESSYPVSDMAETSDAFEIYAELPGYDKSNVKIELANDRTLVLSGSMAEQHETRSGGETSTSSDSKQVIKNQGDPHYWVKERVSTSFSRSFSFPTPINSDSIKASFENGVLKVTVPKMAESQNKQIAIQ